VFNELTKLFSRKSQERRHSQNGNELVPGIGMEISLNGLLFATITPPATPEFDVIMEIASRKIRLRLHTARSGTINMCSTL
jgi:hypothetical protein